MRRAENDPIIWEYIHWFTMTVLGFRIVRGYNIIEPHELVRIYLDPAHNWAFSDLIQDWYRKSVPYPNPVWRSRNDKQK